MFDGTLSPNELDLTERVFRGLRISHLHAVFDCINAPSPFPFAFNYLIISW